MLERGFISKLIWRSSRDISLLACPGIQVASPEHRSKILEALSGRIASIAVHSYGCRVIQRLLEHCTQNQLVNALEELHQATDKLAYNPYGNYVLQHLLCQGSEDDVHRIATVCWM